MHSTTCWIPSNYSFIEIQQKSCLDWQLYRLKQWPGSMCWSFWRVQRFRLSFSPHGLSVPALLVDLHVS